MSEVIKQIIDKQMLLKYMDKNTLQLIGLYVEAYVLAYPDIFFANYPNGHFLFRYLPNKERLYQLMYTYYMEV